MCRNRGLQFVHLIGVQRHPIPHQRIGIDLFQTDFADDQTALFGSPEAGRVSPVPRLFRPIDRGPRIKGCGTFRRDMGNWRGQWRPARGFAAKLVLKPRKVFGRGGNKGSALGHWFNPSPSASDHATRRPESLA